MGVTSVLLLTDDLVKVTASARSSTLYTTRVTSKVQKITRNGDHWSNLSGMWLHYQL